MLTEPRTTSNLEDEGFSRVIIPLDELPSLRLKSHLFCISDRILCLEGWKTLDTQNNSLTIEKSEEEEEEEEEEDLNDH
jgi:hypothetical protein